MKRLIEKITGGYSSRAKVVEGTLIISLPDATSPVVWRMELGQAKASAMEVQKAENGLHVLALKTPKGEVHDIASFDSRGKAVEALMGISRAMEQTGGQAKQAPQMPAVTCDEDFGGNTAPPPPGYSYPKHRSASRDGGGGGGGKWVAGIIGVIILLLMIWMVLHISPRTPVSLASATSTATGTPANATGVPLSADDFLRGR